MKYSTAIREGFAYLLRHHPKVFVMGQGVWSPWYVGGSMVDLDKEFGKHRVIDTPVSENALTATAVGASLFGYRPVIVHPRMDFMILATDALVNQAAKWHHMLGGKASPAVTIRAIINRGGEQGAQHSQALHAWYAHVPGLRVVMPASVKDARDLLIASVLSDAPVLYIDDRWLYERDEDLGPPEELKLSEQGPAIVREGKDVTIIGVGHGAYLAEMAAAALSEQGIECEVVDVRVLNPLKPDVMVRSVSKTGRLCVVDPGNTSGGFSSEVMASVLERLEPGRLKSKPARVALPDAPAPTSKLLETNYFIRTESVTAAINRMLAG